MITRITLVLLMTMVTASADPLPVVKRGSCPSGYFESASGRAPSGLFHR